MDKRYIISSFFNNNEFNVSDIMQIIIEHKIEYSSNSNGVFVNLSLLEDTIIDKIYDKLQVLTTKKEEEYIPSKTKQPNPKRKVKKYKDTISLTEIDKLVLSLSSYTLTI